MPASSLAIISKCTVYPETKSSIESLKLSVSDLPMLSCHYIQKGLLFNRPPLPIDALLTLLQSGLSQTLTHFPALAGRLMTDSDGFVHISCNDAGADFTHANMAPLCIRDVLSPTHVPESVKEFFAFTNTVSYEGHFKPILAVQVTELADGVFIGCAVNHSVTDGTSFWNFFNSFAEICRGAETISKLPDFRRNFVKDSLAVIRFPEGTPKVTFDENAPLKERIFSFSREAIRKLKSRANAPPLKKNNGFIVEYEYPSKKLIDDSVDQLLGKQSNNDPWENNDDDENQNPNGIMITSVIEKRLLFKQQQHHHHGLDAAAAAAAAATGGGGTETFVDPTVEISSFQSLSAQLWRSVTRARKLPPSKMATFRMAVNCRQRLEPKIDPLYFGNAIQSIPTVASVGDVLSRDLRWCAAELNKNVIAHDDAKVRRCVDDWEKNPRCFPLGNLDGASMTMGSSPRFPMYDNDFGWGRPLAVRSGRANKFDGKISAFPGRDGDGSVDLEVCLAPETMAGLENDWEFMQYVVQD